MAQPRSRRRLLLGLSELSSYDALTLALDFEVANHHHRHDSLRDLHLHARSSDLGLFRTTRSVVGAHLVSHSTPTQLSRYRGNSSRRYRTREDAPRTAPAMAGRASPRFTVDGEGRAFHRPFSIPPRPMHSIIRAMPAPIHLAPRGTALAQLLDVDEQTEGAEAKAAARIIGRG